MYASNVYSYEINVIHKIRKKSYEMIILNGQSVFCGYYVAYNDGGV